MTHYPQFRFLFRHYNRLAIIGCTVSLHDSHRLFQTIGRALCVPSTAAASRIESLLRPRVSLPLRLSPHASPSCRSSLHVTLASTR